MANVIEVEIISRLDKIEKNFDALSKNAERAGKKVGDNFSEGFEEALDGLKSFGGASKSIAGLVGSLKAIAPVAVGVAAGVFAIKEALDLTFSGEKILAITNQFDVLSERAGISSEVLISGFERAADGMVDTTDIMQSANKALVELGGHARELPQVFTLARQASAVFGGEVTQNFELMNQAIASGNTRALRQLGIFIDSEQAIKSYAKSVGIAVENLTLAGKQSAVLNALLEKGATAFNGVNLNTQQTTNAFQKLKVAMTDIGEAIEVIVAKVFGPTFTEFANKLAEMAKAMNLRIKENLGSDAEQTSAKIKILGEEIGVLTRNQENLTQRIQNSIGLAKIGLEEALPILQKELAQKRAQLDLLRQEERLLDSVNAKKTGVTAQAPEEDQAKVAQQLEQLRATNATGNIAILNDHANFLLQKNQLDASYFQSSQAIEAQRLQSLADLNTKYQGTTLQKSLEFESAKTLIEEKAEMQRLALKDKIDKERVANQKSTFSTIATLSSNNNSTLASIGKAAGIAQIAIDTPVAIGRALAAFPPPFNFVAAGLVGAAMAAQAAALGGVGVSNSVPTGGGGFGGGGIGTSPTVTEITDIEEQKPQTNVTVNIQGNVLDRRQTGLEIAEVINETFGTNGIVIANTA